MWEEAPDSKNKTVFAVAPHISLGILGNDR
jgi:hypothetical protein